MTHSQSTNSVEHHIYMLKCCDGSLYTGYTPDIEERLKKHRDGKGSKYVRSRLPIELVYSEDFPDKVTAMQREAEIKRMTREEKMELVGQG